MIQNEFSSRQFLRHVRDLCKHWLMDVLSSWHSIYSFWRCSQSSAHPPPAKSSSNRTPTEMPTFSRTRSLLFRRTQKTKWNRRVSRVTPWRPKQSSRRTCRPKNLSSLREFVVICANELHRIKSNQICLLLASAHRTASKLNRSESSRMITRHSSWKEATRTLALTEDVTASDTQPMNSASTPSPSSSLKSPTQTPMPVSDRHRKPPQSRLSASLTSSTSVIFPHQTPTCRQATNTYRQQVTSHET